MRSRFKSWAKPYLEEHHELVLSSIKDDPSFFVAPLALEVGAGKGGFLLEMAAKHPERKYLALERDVSICGTFAKRFVESEIANVRLMVGDFDDLYEEIKELRFAEIFLNFSDPWPKKKHAKRRLTTAKRLSLFASLLEDDGLLKIKTDNDSLYDFTLEEGEKAPLSLLKAEFDYASLEESDVASEYETSFRLLGKKIHRIIYKKEERK